MKIHTTQNLNSLVQLNQQATNNVSSRDFRLKNYSEQMLMPKLSADKVEYQGTSISFGKKNIKDAKKIINTSAKMVGEIIKDPQPKRKGADKFIEGSFFNYVLSKHEFEPAIQAGAAALICIFLRPATIIALPSNGKTKEDNIYAASHSFASGIVGLIATLCLTTPFKAGGNYVTSVLRKDFKPEVLERLYPQLDTKSIWADKAKGTRKNIKEWKNKDGKKFIDNIKNIQFLTEFKQLADVSDLTYKKVLNLDIDWASQKGKSFNDVVLKDGSKLYDKLNMSNVGIVVEEEGYGKSQILLQDLDKEFLEGIIKDSKGVSGNNWGSLDIKSVYGKDGNVVDFRHWKDVNGKAWHLDLDKAYITSPIEEITRKPRLSGRKRFDSKDKEYKYITYQNNGIEGGLGTPVDEKLVEAANTNEAQIKLLTWGPDILTRVPVAATTIALIPWTLKHIFGIEKSKKKAEKKAEQNKPIPVKELNKKEIEQPKDVTFKGKKTDPDKANWFIKQFGKYYGKPIIESEKIANVSKKLNNLPGKLTEHMMTLGSFITSGVYVTRTLQNKDLDPERKQTLAINQLLCFLVPTAAAYTVNRILDSKIKNFEYRVSNKMQYAKEYAEFSGKEAPKFLKNIKNVQGIRILSSIGVFSLIYRYLTPVAMTPAANWFGEKLLTKQKAKKALAENNQQTAVEIPINSNQNTAKEISIRPTEQKQTA